MTLNVRQKPDDVSAEDLALIVRHQGYEPIVDTCGGYNVERIILDKPYAGQMLFHPYRYHEQALQLSVYLRAHVGLPLDEIIVPYMSVDEYVDKVVREAIKHFQAVDKWKSIVQTKKETKP